MDDNLKKWVKENKLIISESKSDNGLDIINIDTVGSFLYIHPGDDGKLIDEDFSFILSDEEYEMLDEKKVNYILFEFGSKFYYSGIKLDRNKYNEPIYKPEFLDFKYLGRCAEPFTMPFVNLGVHDEYEMLSGSGSCDLWCKKAKFLGHEAIGVCDVNSLASSLSFQTYAEKYGLKCIIGETIKVAKDYDATQDIQETFDLKLYVMSEVGWHNLLLISKTVNVDYDGFIPDTELYKYGSGICCVVPKNSHFNYLVRNDERNEAKKLLQQYKKSFKRVYYQIDTVEYVSKQLFREHLSDIDNYIRFFRNDVKPILINDSYYLDEEEKDLKGMLHKISGIAAPEANNQYFKSVSDTLRAYEDGVNFREDTVFCDTVKIERVNLNLEFPVDHIVKECEVGVGNYVFVEPVFELSVDGSESVLGDSVARVFVKKLIEGHACGRFSLCFVDLTVLEKADERACEKLVCGVALFVIIGIGIGNLFALCVLERSEVIDLALKSLREILHLIIDFINFNN
mgnify:CR=1 FL=1